MGKAVHRCLAAVRFAVGFLPRQLSCLFWTDFGRLWTACWSILDENQGLKECPQYEFQ